MIVSQIYPDEFIFSYLIRLAKSNGLPDSKSALAKINQLQLIKHSNRSTLDHLSASLQITPEQLVKNHTLLPFNKAIIDCDSSDAKQDLQFSASEINYYLSLNKQFVFKACECCVEEDLNYFGFIYIRRMHQITGVNFCTKHERHLKFFDVKNEFFVFSDESQYGARVFDSVIERYQTIAEAVAMSTYRIAKENIEDLFQFLLISKGFKTSSRDEGKAFSDFVYHNTQKWWTECIFHNIEDKMSKGNFKELDSPSSRNKTSSYVLGLSVLIDNADNAINLIELIKSREYLEHKREFGFLSYFSNCKLLKQESLIVRSYLDKKVKANLQQSCDFKIKIHTNRAKSILNFNKNEIKAFMDFQGGLNLIDSAQKHQVRMERLEFIIRTAGRKVAESLKNLDLIDSNFNKQYESNCT
ncbi:MAG: TniQ family protein [Methylophilus sp.]|nr:TniQ family protein [Methylophilus sp.]